LLSIERFRRYPEQINTFYDLYIFARLKLSWRAIFVYFINKDSIMTAVEGQRKRGISQFTKTINLFMISLPLKWSPSGFSPRFLRALKAGY